MPAPMAATPPCTAPAPVVAGGGRILNARKVIDRWFTMPDDELFVSERWVRDNLPGKVVVSETRVGWYEQDVEYVVNEARRTGTPIAEIQLPIPAR